MVIHVVCVYIQSLVAASDYEPSAQLEMSTAECMHVVHVVTVCCLEIFLHFDRLKFDCVHLCSCNRNIYYMSSCVVD